MNTPGSANASASPPPNEAIPAPDALPDDPVVLKRMILELLASLHTRDRELEQVRHRLDQLLQRLYGKRGERFDPNQPWLFPDMQAEATAGAAAPAPASSGAASKPPQKKNGHGRRVLPDNLPRVRVVHELNASECACPECGTARRKISEEISEQLDYQPASLFVVQHVRGTYACPKCQGHVTTADKPAQPIAKGLPGPGLLAQIITSKYDEAMPLHRQQRYFKRHGLELSRSTTCDWMAACAQLLRPLYDRMKQEVLASRVLHTDDTTLPVQDEQRDQTRKGRLWAYLGDRDHPHNVFDYTPSRKRDGPVNFLKDFRGYLQADAFSGYDGIYLGSQGAIIEVACNAHARRKFHEARKSDAARSAAALGWYQELYAIERQAREQLAAWAEERGQEVPADDADALRLRLRQEKSVPLLEKFKTWLQEQTAVLPKSPMGEAIGYTLGNWDALVRYTQAGFLAIDNNLAEREMKQIAIGRKNFLFVGSDKGGATAAVLYTFISTCRRHHLDPFAYLRDVLARLAEKKLQGDDLAALLPHRWAVATQPPQPAS